MPDDSRDPEDRLIDETDPLAKKDKMLDRLIADTFPASDPPSSVPDPDQDSFAVGFLHHAQTTGETSAA
jgi:hypothetical protein